MTRIRQDRSSAETSPLATSRDWENELTSGRMGLPRLLNKEKGESPDVPSEP